MRRSVLVGLLLGLAAGEPQHPHWRHSLIPLDRAPQRLRVARLDADPWPDIVSVVGPWAGLSGSVLTVWRGSASSEFTTHWETPLTSWGGDNGIPLDVGDLDADGHNDLLLANHSGHGGTFLRFGDGSGRFPTEQLGPEYGGQMDDARLIDDDGDGDLDILATTFDGGQLNYLDRFEAVGGGDFILGGYWFFGYTFEWNDIFVGGGDLTDAATLDHLVIAEPGAKVTLLPGPISYPIHDPVARATTADFDGNGFDDVAATTPLTHAVQVMLSPGSAPFPAPRSYAVGRQPAGLVAADVDLDGDLDLAVCNTLSNTVSLLRNRGNGGFELGSPLPVGAGPVEIDAGDLDLDGDPDLVVGNRDGRSLSVLLNPAR